MPAVSQKLKLRGSFRRRRGVIIVLFALLMLSLIGMLGLVIDSGMMMSQTRQLNNVADAAALAAARDLLGGRTSADAIATARTFVSQYNGVTAVNEGVVNIPPQTGPYAGLTGFAEVILQQQLTTYFIQVLPGMGTTQTVSARAVAGYEAVSAGEGVAVLRPTASPGLEVAGQANIRVNGRVIVNSQGSLGQDENGTEFGGDYHAANGGPTNNANNAVYATDIRVVGRVNSASKFRSYDVNGGNPLHTSQLPEPDPLINLPTPTVSNGIRNVNYGSVSTQGNSLPILNAPPVGNNPMPFRAGGSMTIGSYNLVQNDVVFFPGIYSDISISSIDGTAYFMPGIYVLQPESGQQNKGLGINSNTSVVGHGVLFYATTSTFDVTTGAPDTTDGSSPTLVTGQGVSKINFTGGTNSLRAISRTYNSASTDYGPAVSELFDGVLLFQRRANGQNIDIGGNAQEAVMQGTLYAAGGRFVISGQGQYDTQFVAGSLTASGQGTVTILNSGSGRGRANQIFLVE